VALTHPSDPTSSVPGSGRSVGAEWHNVVALEAAPTTGVALKCLLVAIHPICTRAQIVSPPYLHSFWGSVLFGA